MRATDVVLAELLNRRPPAAWLAASHDGSGDGQADELIQLVRVVAGMADLSLRGLRGARLRKPQCHLQLFKSGHAP